MTERWIAVPGFPGYEASDHGRFRSFRPRRHQSVTEPLILQTRARRNGYLVVWFRDGVRKHSKLAHRMTILAFRGPCPDGDGGGSP